MSSSIPVQQVPDFLPEEAFARLHRFAQQKRGQKVVFGLSQDAFFLEPLFCAAERHLPAVRTLAAQNGLLRFEAHTGLLHHDLNYRPHRVLSLLYYLEAPQRGGELVFPFFSASGAPTTNPVTEACTQLHRAGQYFAKDPRLEAYMIEHRDRLWTIPVHPNAAIAFPSHDPTMWHFVCPIEAGLRSCIVVFYHPSDAPASAGG